MRLRELRRWLARADVQTAAFTSAALALCVLLPGMGLYAHLASEEMRELDRWYEFALDVAVREVDEHGVEALAGENLRGRLANVGPAVRLRAPTGEVIFE